MALAIHVRHVMT